MNVTKWATTTLLIFALAGLGGGLGVGGYQLAQGDSLAPRAKAAVRDDKPAAGEHPQSNISGVPPAVHWKHERFKGLGRPFSLVFSPNSKTLVMGCFEGDLVCWDVENRRLLLEWTGHPGPIEALAISPDGNLLASSGDDNEIRVWQLATGARKTSLKGTRSHIDLLSFSPDGKSLTATDATSVILWDVAAEKQRFRLERSLNGSRMPVPSSFTDATSLALVTLNNGKPALKIVDVQTGKLRQNVAIPFAYDGWDESWCTISPLGRWFVQIDRSLRVVDLTAGRGKLYFFGPDPNRNRIGGAYALVVSPDERFAAIALDNHQVVVVELATGLIRGEYSWPGRAYTCFAFSPDCRYLACGAVDRSVLLWDLSGWQFKNARASVALSTADLDRLWDELTTNNGPILQRAIWTFVAGQKKSVTYLKAKLLPVGASREQIANSIRDLGDNNFKAGVRAESELEKLHDEAEGQLKKALAEASDLETRRRIEKLVNLIDGPWSRGHIVRSIEVLERCGTPEARQLLELLADNRLSLRRAGAARESLRRWAYATDAVPKQ